MAAGSGGGGSPSSLASKMDDMCNSSTRKWLGLLLCFSVTGLFGKNVLQLLLGGRRPGSGTKPDGPDGQNPHLESQVVPVVLLHHEAMSARPATLPFQNCIRTPRLVRIRVQNHWI